MTLTNHWWLLIWLLICRVLFHNFPKRYERLDGRIVKRWAFLPTIIMVVPYIIWAGYRKNFIDTGSYRSALWGLPYDISDIPSLFNGDKKDPGFTVLLIFLKKLIGNQDVQMFLIIATFQMLCVALVYRKYSSDVWTSLLLFVISTDYMSWVQNGMRQFIACCMIFACFKWLLNKRYIPLIIVILLASTIHGSALLMIPIIFVVQGEAWNIKTILMMAATAVMIAYIDQFTPLMNDLLQNTQYDDVMSNEIWTTDDGTNLIRVLVYSVPAIVSLVGLKIIRVENNPVINICVNCSIVTMALYLVAAVTSGIYIGRLPIYTTLMGYISLPWLIDRIFVKRSAAVVRVMMMTMYVLFFYYQMFIGWRLHG